MKCSNLSAHLLLLFSFKGTAEQKLRPNYTIRPIIVFFSFLFFPIRSFPIASLFFSFKIIFVDFQADMDVGSYRSPNHYILAPRKYIYKKKRARVVNIFLELPLLRVRQF